MEMNQYLTSSHIRLALVDDLPQIQTVYTAARQFMRANGNLTQWNDSYPSDVLLLRDIEKQQLYVEESNGSVHAVFVLAMGEDPTYTLIEGGSWLSDSPYGTIHRIASDGTTSGVFRRCVAFCQQKIAHLRIDTHADNLVMQHLLDASGFQRCGVIYLMDGSPRLAYELLE